MISRRLILAGAGLAFTSRKASAQAFPSRPITIVVPLAAGGASDTIARAVGQNLSGRLGWSMIVENKPGAASVIGAGQVARAEPDGHTLLLAPPPFIITQFATPKPPYDALRDFAPVTLLVTNPLAVTVSARTPVRSLKELIAYAKTNPGKLTYGSPGAMSLPHLATELFARRAGGLDLVHVPYRGGGPAVTDLLAGRINLMITSPIEVLQHAQAGHLAILALTAEDGLAAMPMTPSVQNAGLANYAVKAWFGIVAPAGTPPPVIERLNREITAALRSPEVETRLVAQGVQIDGSSAEAFGSFLAREHALWGEIAKTMSQNTL